jgi:hypothetical protein
MNLEQDIYFFLLVLSKTRNERNFKDKPRSVSEIVEKIKVLSWRWSLSGLKVSHCNLYNEIMNVIGTRMIALIDRFYSLIF